MSGIIEAIKFIKDHYDVILQGIVTILSSLGVICEAINRILPNKGDESAISKFGKIIVNIGTYIQKAMDFLKIPNKKV